MNITEIVTHLKSERSRIDRAISVLEEVPSNGTANSTQGQRSAGQQKHHGISAAGRKRLSEMMKKRWAERRKVARKK